jgi:hypothetical protein
MLLAVLPRLPGEGVPLRSISRGLKMRNGFPQRYLEIIIEIVA